MAGQGRAALPARSHPGGDRGELTLATRPRYGLEVRPAAGLEQARRAHVRAGAGLRPEGRPRRGARSRLSLGQVRDARPRHICARRRRRPGGGLLSPVLAVGQRCGQAGQPAAHGRGSRDAPEHAVPAGPAPWSYGPRRPGTGSPTPRWPRPRAAVWRSPPAVFPPSSGRAWPTSLILLSRVAVPATCWPSAWARSGRSPHWERWHMHDLVVRDLEQARNRTPGLTTWMTVQAPAAATAASLERPRGMPARLRSATALRRRVACRCLPVPAAGGSAGPGVSQAALRW